MSAETTTKPAAPRARYRIPSIKPEVEAVSLDDFDTEEIRAYLRWKDTGKAPPEDARGEMQTFGDRRALEIDVEDLNRIETLALCGQLEHARAEALRIVGDHIGRNL